jgi:hypothetical protein
MVVGLITDNDETAYREEVRDLAEWCQDNNLSLNVSKTKEMIMDYRKRGPNTLTFTPTWLLWSGSRVSSTWVSTSPTMS